MMQEDEFPGFQKLYRQLRKEAVPFPKRDPNLRAMMSSICSDSPMFDYVEQIAGREANSNVAPKQQANQSNQQKQKEQEERKEVSVYDEMFDQELAIEKNYS